MHDNRPAQPTDRKLLSRMIFWTTPSVKAPIDTIGEKIPDNYEEKNMLDVTSIATTARLGGISKLDAPIVPKMPSPCGLHKTATPMTIYDPLVKQLNQLPRPINRYYAAQDHLLMFESYRIRRCDHALEENCNSEFGYKTVELRWHQIQKQYSFCESVKTSLGPANRTTRFYSIKGDLQRLVINFQNNSDYFQNDEDYQILIGCTQHQAKEMIQERHCFLEDTDKRDMLRTIKIKENLGDRLLLYRFGTLSCQNNHSATYHDTYSSRDYDRLNLGQDENGVHAGPNYYPNFGDHRYTVAIVKHDIEGEGAIMKTRVDLTFDGPVWDYLKRDSHSINKASAYFQGGHLIEMVYASRSPLRAVEKLFMSRREFPYSHGPTDPPTLTFNKNFRNSACIRFPSSL